MINQNKFEGAVRSAGCTQNTLAEEMHMSANTFSSKKKNGTFTIAQVQWLCTRLGITKAEDKCDIFMPSKFQNWNGGEQP
jgi:transcriptional regulator with XRE-family HTH domain